VRTEELEGRGEERSRQEVRREGGTLGMQRQGSRKWAAAESCPMSCDFCARERERASERARESEREREKEKRERESRC
jgi:hypothetical protein